MVDIVKRKALIELELQAKYFHCLKLFESTTKISENGYFILSEEFKGIFMQVSKLHLYSYGIVAINKARSSDEIEVTPIEVTPMADGEITDAVVEEKAKGKDADGASFEASVNTSSTIKARWLPFGSNRATSPDVRRGEKVAIYRFADADKYYWTSLEYDAKLRKLETAIYTFSNTQVESEDSTPETCYFFEVSTHDKVVKLHTSTSDGEPYGYDFVLNTKDGSFTITDTIDNRITLDSEQHQIIAINTEGSFIEILKEDINIFAVRDLNVQTGRNFNTRVGANKNTKVDGAEDKRIDQTQSIDVGGSASLSVGSTIDYTAPSGMNIKAPDVNASDNVNTGKAVKIGTSLSTGANGGGQGDSVINGNIRVTGSVNISGYLSSASGATFAGSVSAPNI